MSPIERLDEWIISRLFEPLTWRLEEKFSVTAFDLARYVLVLYPAGVFFGMMLDMSWVLLIAMPITFGLAVFIYFETLRIERDTKKGLANPWRMLRLYKVMRFHLGLWVSILIASTQGNDLPFWTAIMLGGLWFTLTFGACNVMPPGYELRNTRTQAA